MGDYYSRAAKHVDLLGDGASGAWRQPQLGALGATLAHWTLAERDPTVVSIPTGTGKTAVAMAAPFLAPRAPSRVLVLAPSRAIREQLATQFASQSQLHRLGVLSGEAGLPNVAVMSGRSSDWSDFDDADVVVALPNSISPSHYEEGDRPPAELFDLIIVDEAHHAPASTWRAVLDHFVNRHALLLTATPRRRDGRRIPGSLEYYYPLRRALDEGLYKPIEPVLLTPPDPTNRSRSDAAIAGRAAEVLATAEHRTSTLLVRAGNIARLSELRATYESVGVDLTLLHNRLGSDRQAEITEQLRAGEVRAVGVVGMLGEGFDLPSIRVVSYHDKHRSLPATVQLLGRLSRVDGDHPQPSVLIAVADADVFPELQGVVRDLYAEDADWIEVLPGLIDEDVQREREDRQFVQRFPASRTEVDPSHLEPTKRAIVYEVPADWEPKFLAEPPNDLQEGAPFAGGTIQYSGSDVDAGLLVVVVRYAERPKWSTDPALTNLKYELHVVAHRRPPRVDLPGLVLINLDRKGLRKRFEELLGLDEVGQAAGPERISGYLDSLERISVSSVGVRSTNAATRGRATYRNFMGSGVDRGLRTVDMARSALGHVMFQVNTASGSANAGAAVERSKLWLTRYGQLREFSEWVDATAALLWFPREGAQGPLLPGVDRGHQFDAWPDANPLAAEMYPGLLGMGLELWTRDSRLGYIEDLDLYVNDDPTGTLDGVAPAADGPLRVVGVFHDRVQGREELVWDALFGVDGRITPTTDLLVRRGYGSETSLSELLEENPPTIHFLDGTSTIGRVRYDSRSLTSAFDLGRLTAIDWPNVDITAEAPRTADARGGSVRSVHERLGEHLAGLPRVGMQRWILYNDGAGEIADYIVVEELASGEIRLALWHAKPAGGSTPSVRVKDFQEVVAQAIRSRRQFPSTALWPELARRLVGDSKPVAELMGGSDDVAVLRRRLGIDESEDDHPPWTVAHPVVRGLLGIAQPGLSVQELRRQLALDDVPAGAQSLRELFSVLADTAIADGVELAFLASA